MTPRTVLILDSVKAQKNVENLLSNKENSVAIDAKRTYQWIPLIFMISIHLSSVYSIYLVIFSAKWQTVLFAVLLILVSAVGVTAGVHRYWTHRSYKAKMPLQILLMVMYSVSFEGDIISWCIDHRMHHKYSDTDADPHNSARGLFYSHIGWILVSKHPKYFEKIKTMDFSDLYNDPIAKIHKKYYALFAASFSYIIPTAIPFLLWREGLMNSFFVATVLRMFLVLHITWSVNSFAHAFGYKPYDKNIASSENKVVSFLASGEGFHNYHHVFPWDYKAAELGNYSLNVTTAFLDLMAKIGWAYELKFVPKKIIENRIKRTGDGSQDILEWKDEDRRIFIDKLLEN